MKTRSRASRLFPAMLVAVATAIPVVTTAEILARVSGTSTSVAQGQSQSSGQLAAVPMGTAAAGSSSAATTTSGTSSATAVKATSQSYTGTAVQNQFGTVQATLVVTAGKITDVIITAPQDNGRSADINSQAVPILRSETLQAQSANINMVSGATYTSESYLQSLQSALDAAHL